MLAEFCGTPYNTLMLREISSNSISLFTGRVLLMEGFAQFVLQGHLKGGTLHSLKQGKRE